MEQYYYNHMDKQKQAAYHGILQGITSLADEFQIPAPVSYTHLTLPTKA